MNPGAVLHFLGRLMALIGVAMLAPFFCALVFGEFQAAGAFLISGVSTAAIGFSVVQIFKDRTGDLYRSDGVLIVVGGWVTASIFGAVPYLLTGSLASPIDALFESASGFTTTGSTILVDIESLGKAMLFWRSFTQYLGGMGIIVLFVALLPELGTGARFVYKLEVPGPTAKTLQPRVRDTAFVLWMIYILLTVLEILALLLAGMGLYDAMTHTFSTLATGGFSPRAGSIAAFDSIAIEIVIIVFMLLAGANFSLYYGLRSQHLREGLRVMFFDREIRIYLTIVVVLSAVILSSVWMDGLYDNPGRAFLDSVFQVTSILTGTGFGTADFDRWPDLSRLLLVGLMFVGGCAGSTTGGMKIMRVAIGFKAAFREVRLMFSPNSVLAVFVGRQPVPNGVVASVMGFLLLYIGIWALGSVFLSIGAPDLETAASASIAVLGNIGPGLSEVGTTNNFAFFSGWQKLVMVLLMLLGRLEVYPLAALATAAFWRR
jgi:trk system potassium uptake protein TrkH